MDAWQRYVERSREEPRESWTWTCWDDANPGSHGWRLKICHGMVLCSRMSAGVEQVRVDPAWEEVRPWFEELRSYRQPQCKVRLRSGNEEERQLAQQALATWTGS